MARAVARAVARAEGTPGLTRRRCRASLSRWPVGEDQRSEHHISRLAGWYAVTEMSRQAAGGPVGRGRGYQAGAPKTPRYFETGRGFLFFFLPLLFSWCSLSTSDACLAISASSACSLRTSRAPQIGELNLWWVIAVTIRNRASAEPTRSSSQSARSMPTYSFSPCRRVLAALDVGSGNARLRPHERSHGSELCIQYGIGS